MTELIILSHYLVLLTLGLTLYGCAFSCYQLLYKESADSRVIEHTNTAITLIYIFVSLVLLYAFYSYDFSVKYVHNYSDKSLPLFYRLTAFWGGQAGSLLFWALSVVACGLAFQHTNSYKTLSGETRCWYLLFYFTCLAFFSFLLTTYNDPFVLLSPAPDNGQGLNPLLQHPGMIFHPPLLLLGYGGFTIPACLALAQAMSTNTTSLSRETSWYKSTRVLMLAAWLSLSAGIVLGAWWAYMELGWGGYWAWDPVENASLVPWFFATAAIHLGFVNAYRNKAGRFHTLIMGLTYVSAFFATWLVRGNVVASIHAFSSGGVGPIIGMYVLITAIAVFGICFIMPKSKNELNGLETREGLTLSTAILLLTIAVIIMIATLWPVISLIPKRLLGEPLVNSVGLGVDFYNRVILPLFTVIITILTVCPWVSWNGELRHKKYLSAVILAFFVCIGIVWTVFEITIPLALLATSVAVTCIISWSLYVYEQKYNKLSPAFVHIGLAMMVLGAAISGPYKMERDVVMKPGDSIFIDGFDVKLTSFYTLPVYYPQLTVTKGDKSDTFVMKNSNPLKVGEYTIQIEAVIDNRTNDHGRDLDLVVTKGEETPTLVHLKLSQPKEIGDFTVRVEQTELNRFSFTAIELIVSKNGKDVGALIPQRRIYVTQPNKPYSEAVTIFSLGKEIYATFSGIDSKGRAHMRISTHPLVNWIWLGAIIMSLAPLLHILGLSNRRNRNESGQD